MQKSGETYKEAAVRADDGAAAADVNEGFTERHLEMAHDIGDDDGGRARHTGAAVEQHTLALLQGRVQDGKDGL